MSAIDRINLVVAHSAEAKPLCRMFDLRAVTAASTFPLFRNDHGITLIVSGMGKCSSAAATGYLAGQQIDTPNCAWLNIGIAGHQHAEVGSAMLAHKITDAASGISYYPPQVVAEIPSTPVVTVEKPQRHYPDPVTYDMEAAGYYASASRFMTAELVQAFKIVSDNRQHPLEQFDITQVGDLIAMQQDSLTRIIERLNELLSAFRAAYALPPGYQDLVEKYRFSKSQQVQLRRFCERYRALEKTDYVLAISKQLINSRKQVLETLRAGLSGQDLF